MILNNSVKIKNYKCFAEEEQGFERVLPINIIIGKNNSGKSSLIDLISYLVDPKDSFLATGRNKIASEVIISDIVTSEQLEIAFYAGKGRGGGSIPGSHYDYGMKLVGQEIKYSLGSKKNIFQWRTPPVPGAKEYIARLTDNLISPLYKKHFFRIAAERDLRPEGADSVRLTISPNGNGATNVIRRVVNDASLDLDIVKLNLLQALNEIVLPDIEFADIAPREQNGEWEVYLKDKHAGLIPISKMGSGIKTILLVLLNLIVIPEIERISKKDLVFGFEELENNLHPSLQRRLFNYISRYSSENSSYFFITTHSNVVIDLFGKNINSQVVHVLNQGKSSIAKTVITNDDGRSVLKDLEFKPSDLLMSNGIIWVEGPSDIVYLELLLELLRRNEVSGIRREYNYTIQSLATAVWKYAGFVDFDWKEVSNDIQNRIVSLQKLNSNHLLVLDGDSNYENKPPSLFSQFKSGVGKNKAMLIHESMKFSRHFETELSNNYGDTNDGKLFFWVTEGTFESYLEYFVLTKGNEMFGVYFDLEKKRGYFEKRREGASSSKSKVELAVEISKFFVDAGLSIDDIAPVSSALRDKLERLKKTIASWN